MASATSLLSPTWNTIKDQMRDLREERATRKTLERELAAYTSADDLNDLDAILDRYSDEETEAIRHLLSGRRG